MISSSSSSRSSSSDNTNNAPPGPILLVGVTGGTGRSVLAGLLAAGIHNSSLKVLTRNPQGSAAKWFEAQGVGVIAGDLDDADNVKNVVQGKVGVGVGYVRLDRWCTATGKDDDDVQLFSFLLGVEFFLWKFWVRSSRFRRKPRKQKHVKTWEISLI